MCSLFELFTGIFVLVHFCFLSTTSGDCTLSRVCPGLTRRFCSLADSIFGTVTCRQFPNLTFAPRKTCIECSNLTLHSYHATAILSINQGLWDCKYFFCEIVFFLYFFSYKAILGVYMMKIRKNCPVSMQSRLILLRFISVTFYRAPVT